MMPIISKAFLCKIAIPQPVPIVVRKSHELAKKYVAWEKPKKGWMKLNYDGSCKGKTGRSSIGGIIRDHNAGFVLGYAESIGKYKNSTIPELVALLRGLEIVQENGWNNIWLEGDSKGLLDIIERMKPAKCEEMNKYLMQIKLIIPEIRNYNHTHVYREGNRAADKFAQMGHQSKRLQIWRHVPPNEVMRIVDEDAQGKTLPRKR